MKPSISLQLWSVKEDCERDFLHTLTQVKAYGYDAVEFAGYHGVPAETLRAHLDSIGLGITGSHISFEQLTDRFEETLAFEKTLGNRRIIVPYQTCATMAEWHKYFRQLSRLSGRLAQEGCQLGYHNHAHELTETGQDVLDAMTKEVAGLTLEVDTYWLAYAGVPVVPWLTAHRSVIRELHLKDMLAENRESTELGKGCLPLEDYVAFARENDIRHLVVEQEAFQQLTPMESARMNAKVLKQLVGND